MIVNWNSRELVCQCLESIYANAPQCEFEIIVSDNGSKDGSCEAIEAQFPEVRVIRNQRNFGFVVANNRALEVARGAHLLLLNSDTVAQAGSFDRMLNAMSADARVGVVSPRLVYADGSLQLSYGPMPGLFVAFCTFFELRRLVPRSFLALLGSLFGSHFLGSAVGIYTSWLSNDRLPSRELGSDVYVSGACMLIRRECYEQVGGLDPGFFMYVDDADYSKRVHSAGWKILYFADTTIVHLQGGTVGRRYRWNSAPAYQSMLYFMKKHRGSRAFYISKMFAIIAVFGRWLGNLVRGRSERKRYWTLLTEVANYRVPWPPLWDISARSGKRVTGDIAITGQKGPATDLGQFPVADRTSPAD